MTYLQIHFFALNNFGILFSVVYQRPKFSAENEHFQLLTECQIAEFFLNEHVTFDDLQRKKMPSTPSKTNYQANYFESKVVPKNTAD